MRDRSKPSRQGLTETKDRRADTMHELHEKLEKKAKDLTKVRQLLEGLDLDGGTAEGADAIQESVDEAEKVTEEVFDQDDAELAREHDEGESFKSEMAERKETSESNLGHITEVTAPLDTKETIDKIRESKEAALQEVDYLQDLLQRATESIEESKAIEQDLQNIRTSGG